MVVVQVVQMAIMNIVNVTIMDDRSVATGRSVLMGMVGMVLLVTSSHRICSFLLAMKRKITCHFLSAACPNALCTN
jgi:hypothetical protein